MIRYPLEIDKKIKVLESLSNLEHNEAFKVFLNWLISEGGRISNGIGSISDEVSLRWAQGHFQVLDDLLAKIITARTTLEKLRNQPPPQGRA